MIRVVNVRGLRTPEQRAGMCYVGREFAGWPATIWGNPYRPIQGDIVSCLELYRRYAEKIHPDIWAVLWDACHRGEKPLGCWCVNATHGDGQAVVCHAQVLAQMLAERFSSEVSPP